MSNNDHQLLLKIDKEWNTTIVPQLPDIDVEEFDSKYDENGNFIILTPLVHLIYEQEIDSDMDSQIERLEQDLTSTFGKYDFISFSARLGEDYAQNSYQSWVGINVVIKELQVPVNMIREYFKIVLDVNNKAKQLSIG
jgi:hypothetical protein